jgi:hypothetical protein
MCCFARSETWQPEHADVFGETTTSSIGVGSVPTLTVARVDRVVGRELSTCQVRLLDVAGLAVLDTPRVVDVGLTELVHRVVEAADLVWNARLGR